MNDLIVIFAATVPTIALGVWWAFRSAQPQSDPAECDLPVILFKDGMLEYASDEALEKFPIVTGAHDWQDLYEILSPQYPAFPYDPPSTEIGRTIVLGAVGDPTEQLLPFWV